MTVLWFHPFTGKENNHGDALKELVEWRDDSYLELFEIIVDFRKKSKDVPKTIVHDQAV